MKMKLFTLRASLFVAAAALAILISTQYKNESGAYATALPHPAVTVRAAASAQVAPVHINAVAAKNDDTNDRGNYTGQQGLYVEQHDPKNSKLLIWKLWAKGVELNHPDKAVYGTMTGISARLYRQGAPSATMTAPKAVGDSGSGRLTASNGVVMKSLNPVGTTLKADTVVWESKSDKITATGHVVYTDSVRGMTVRCPKLISNTSLTVASTSDVDLTLKSKTNRKRK